MKWTKKFKFFSRFGKIKGNIWKSNNNKNDLKKVRNWKYNRQPKVKMKENQNQIIRKQELLQKFKHLEENTNLYFL
jgi:hypothetical protein